MKVQVRSSIFETNSSSVHAITVSKYKRERYFEYMNCDFRVGDFGWNHIKYLDFESKASYLWTCIVNNFTIEKKDKFYLDKRNKNYIKYKNAIKKALIDAGVSRDCIWFQEEFEEDNFDILLCGSIDHCPGIDFIEALVFNKDRLIRFLFNDDSCITTWNDNEWYISSEKEAEDDADEIPDDASLEEYIAHTQRHDWRHFDIPEDTEWKYLKDN